MDLDAFLSALAEDGNEAVTVINTDHESDLDLADWERLVKNPAWQELEQKVKAIVAHLDRSWTAAKEMHELRHLAGRKEALEGLVAIPHEVIRLKKQALEAQQAAQRGDTGEYD
jgi:uncharacterized protein YPO0396